ncbi:MAG: tetratricopeptide repeat protein [bacterium]|nr:tetratricopeptide repeat protein [bacterium]
MASMLRFRLWVGCLLTVVLLHGELVPNAQAQSSKARATAIYRDAAGYQNNEAYEIAAEEWQKLIREFPDDELAKSARHYLGVCFIHLEDYEQAIGAFQAAVKNPEPKLLEESRINLCWCMFTDARSKAADSPQQKAGLQAAQLGLRQFLKDYPDGDYLDQALFYAGEVEYTLGNADQAVAFYRKLLQSSEAQQSKLRPDAVYALAVAYEELDQDANAAKVFEQFQKEFPDHRLSKEVAIRLADLKLTRGDAAGAAAELQALVDDKDQQLADYVLLRLAYAFEQQGDQRSARDAYQRLIRDYPQSEHIATAAVSLGQLLFQNGNYDEAVQQFRLVLPAKDKAAADAAHWMAVTLIRQNKPQEAAQVAEQALGWAPNNVMLEMDYADAMYAIPNQMKRAQAAYELLARQHEKDPLAARAAYNAAFAALQLRDFTAAREWSEWFLKRFPQDTLRSDVAYVAAESLLQGGEHKAAAVAYAKLRDADPDNSAFSLWTLRQAMAQYLDGQYPDAIQLLNQTLPSLSEQPAQMAEAQYILGASLLYEEKLAAAISQLQASHRTDDKWSSADEVLLLLAEAQQRNKDEAAARSTLELLLEKYPKTRLKAQVEYRLGQLSAASRQFDAAIARYESILKDGEATNYHSFARYGIAWCLMQQEDYQSALAPLRKLLETDPQASVAEEARLAEAMCLRRLDQSEQAAERLSAFLEKGPSGAALENARYELGLALTDQGKLKEANAQLKLLADSAAEYSALDKVLYELAWNSEELGEHEQAMLYFERLANQFPNSPLMAEARYMRAQEFYEQREFEQAAAAYLDVYRRAQDQTLREKAIYKLGWSHFQLEQYEQAEKHFDQQATGFADGELFVDALFMQAECKFKQANYDVALESYRRARTALASLETPASVSEQVQVLILLHGAQCLRELKNWKECERWLEEIPSKHAESPYLGIALYELGYCKQKQDQTEQALKYYAEVADGYRTEIGARARFMMGEIYFAQRDFVQAIPQFQRVMYGFGGDDAPEDIKNWQVKSAFEAARCSEILIENLRGPARDKVIETAQEYYSFIVKKHAAHDLAAQAETRLGELKRIR